MLDLDRPRGWALQALVIVGAVATLVLALPDGLIPGILLLPVLFVVPGLAAGLMARSRGRTRKHVVAGLVGVFAGTLLASQFSGNMYAAFALMFAALPHLAGYLVGLGVRVAFAKASRGTAAIDGH